MISRLTLILICFATFAFAQAPNVTTVFPVNQEVSAAADGVISVTFDTPIDLSTVDYGNFKVFGRWSGPAEVAFSMTNNDQTVEMSLFEPLMAGEWVTVMLTKNIKSASGENMEKGYVWNFWIETRLFEGTQEFQLIQTIELRQPGEDLIQAYGAYAGDLNNDGYSDLTVVNEASDDLRILLNDEEGNYTFDYELITMGNSTPSPNEGADFDSDGEIDLAVCTAQDNELRILFGDGTGTLGNMDNYTTGSNARGLAIIDFEGDGNEDIVIANRESSDLTFFHNDGIGNFSSTSMNPTGTGESGLAVADFNNDGIQDIILGMYTSNEILVLLGDGNSGFTEGAHAEINGQSWMIGVGDFNNDGFVDVASANSHQDNIAILINDGNGDFLDPTYLTNSNAQFPLAIDIGDLDGDGDLDIVPSYYSSSNYHIFKNNGDGEFTHFGFLNAGTNASCAILHDRDNDGDLDISATDEGDDVVFLFKNIEIPVATNELDASLINAYGPNPFTNNILIEPATDFAKGELSIYNNLGVLLRTMEINHQPTIEWNGRKNDGSLAAPGVYFFKIENENNAQVFKALKL